MSLYTHKKLRRWLFLSLILRTIIAVLRHWFLIAIAVIAIHPISPHVLWQYRYSQISSRALVYSDCQYWGVRGLVRYQKGRDCPLLLLIDREKFP